MVSDVLMRRIREEFKEMPGLKLTMAQASRLWGVESDVCRALIESLVASSFLRWTSGGAVIRMER
jgi:hypothetical protein